jgi:riboflavin biosynthesis pyrimidine reductase
MAAVLVATFAVAAVVVAGNGSGGDDGAATFDEVAWCRAASGVSERAEVLEAGFDGDGEAAVVSLLVELETALSLAAADMRPHLARVNDVVVLVGENLASSTVQDALADALVFTDAPRLDEAVAAVSAALTDCGHDPLPAQITSVLR